MPAQNLVNGVDVPELGKIAESLKKQPDLAKFKFHVSNRWVSCGHSRTTVKSFHGVGAEHDHSMAFQLEADEPEVLLGTDSGANPVEHLLNALLTCLTGAMVYHAATRGIEIEELESTAEGDLDVRGFMGLADDIRKGYQNIRVQFRVKSDAPVEKLKECAEFSPVLDVVSHGTNVELDIQKT